MHFVPDDATHMNIRKTVNFGRMPVHFSCVDKPQNVAIVQCNGAMVCFLPAAFGKSHRGIKLDRIGFNFDDAGLTVAGITILVITLAGLAMEFHDVLYIGLIGFQFLTLLEHNATRKRHCVCQNNKKNF